MFRRLSNSWQLVKASWAVLRADKELVVFPIVSGIASIIVIITFAVPMFLAGLFEAMFAGQSGAASIVGYVLVFLFYLAQYFVILFANTALVGAAMIRLDGGDPTVGDGFVPGLGVLALTNDDVETVVAQVQRLARALYPVADDGDRFVF